MSKKQKPKSPLMSSGVKRGFRVYATVVLALTLMFALGTPAYASDDPLAVVNNLSDFIFGLIRAIGLILVGFGIVQVGMSLKSHDPSQRANGFLTLAGGIIITFTREILSVITG
ncbi:MAG: glutamyl-tRNA amidotransferase [Oscillospiraceae bacterium]|nr:glutamyl-tRNA amidotransferase [Oscillospiraceae bacterium]